MKMTKKVLFGAAILAMVFGFASCKAEDDDDENGMLKGSNNDYSVDYTNNGTTVSRGYKTTTFSHAGALCQMTMNKVSAASGAMGYIWDLESNHAKEGSARAEKEPRRFFIFGFNYGANGGSDKVAYYLSMYKNVTDIQLNNMGASGQKETAAVTSGSATEKEYIPLNSANSFKPILDTATGDFVVTVDVYEGGTFTYKDNGKREYTAYDGTYVVDIYNGKVEATDIKAAGRPSSVTGYITSKIIPAGDIGYLTDALAAAKDDKAKAEIYKKAIIKQQNGAVYANCYAGKTLKGSWHYAETYKEAEAIADAE